MEGTIIGGLIAGTCGLIAVFVGHYLRTSGQIVTKLKNQILMQESIRDELVFNQMVNASFIEHGLTDFKQVAGIAFRWSCLDTTQKQGFLPQITDGELRRILVLLLWHFNEIAAAKHYPISVSPEILQQALNDSHKLLRKSIDKNQEELKLKWTNNLLTNGKKFFERLERCYLL